MTINKMTKNDLDLLCEKVDINKIDIGSLFAVKKIIESEINMSIQVDFNEPHLTARNIVCFENCMSKLRENDLVGAWWEMTDITSYKLAYDYVTVGELVLIKTAINNIIHYLDQSK